MLGDGAGRDGISAHDPPSRGPRDSIAKLPIPPCRLEPPPAGTRHPARMSRASDRRPPGSRRCSRLDAAAPGRRRRARSGRQPEAPSPFPTSEPAQRRTSRLLPAQIWPFFAGRRCKMTIRQALSNASPGSRLFLLCVRSSGGRYKSNRDGASPRSPLRGLQHGDHSGR